MSKRDELIPLTQGLRQLRLRVTTDAEGNVTSGDAALDDEVNALITLSIRRVERRLGYRIVDIEQSLEVTPPAPNGDVVVPFAKVRGALFGQSLDALKRRLDDGTDASLIGFVLSHPETERSYGTLAAEFQILRDRVAAAFDWAPLNQIAGIARQALADSNYSEGDAFNTSIALQDDISALGNYAPSAIKPTDTFPKDYYALTTLEAPSGDWPTAVTGADAPRVYLYLGIPAAVLPPEFTHAVQFELATQWRSRGDANFDTGLREHVINGLLDGYQLYGYRG